MEDIPNDNAGSIDSSSKEFSQLNSKFSPERLIKFDSEMLKAFPNIIQSYWFYRLGLMQHGVDFMAKFMGSLKSFAEMETMGSRGSPPLATALAFWELLLLDIELATRGAMSDLKAMNIYHMRKMSEAFSAIFNSFFDEGDENILQYSERQLKLMEIVVNTYPEAVRDIVSEYGFHLDNGGYLKVAQTERFELYQVLPISPGTEVREGGKPILIIPPYVLGANILAFLPGENRSYVHAFANRGIPTYIRLVKDIATTSAVQLMTGEDDVRDTRFFAEKLIERHGRQVTLNGYCQGGFMGVLGLLSGELDGLVDALITCVAPMDGSRSKSLVEYIDRLPYHFRDLGYSLKTLPNGNKVVDGQVMSLVFKLKSIEKEAPVMSYYRDLAMFENQPKGRLPKINKSAAAISHWLTYDITDIPVEITRLSFDSYTKPVSADGTLPVKLFDRPLNFKSIKQKGIKWLICIAQNDDLVDASAALAPLDFVDAEVATFPKGHVAIATSWSFPASQCALHLNYEHSDCANEGSRGPVRFHLDLDEPPENASERQPPQESGLEIEEPA